MPAGGFINGEKEVGKKQVEIKKVLYHLCQYRLCHKTVYVYWLRPNFSYYWNVEIVKYIKKKDVFRHGSSLDSYTSAVISKK